MSSQYAELDYNFEKGVTKMTIGYDHKIDNIAMSIVKDYIINHIDMSDETPVFDLYVVWKAKALQNWKFLISTNLIDGMYYELTYNGDKKEWYIDAYKKFENKCIPDW